MESFNNLTAYVYKTQVLLDPGMHYTMASSLINHDMATLESEEMLALFMSDTTHNVATLGVLSHRDNTVICHALGHVTYELDGNNDTILLSPKPFRYHDDASNERIKEIRFLSHLKDVLIKTPHHVITPLVNAHVSNPIPYTVFEFLHYVFPIENVKANTDLMTHYSYAYYLNIAILVCDLFKGHLLNGNGINTNLYGTLAVQKLLVLDKNPDQESILYIHKIENNTLFEGNVHPLDKNPKSINIDYNLDDFNDAIIDPKTVSELCALYLTLPVKYKPESMESSQHFNNLVSALDKID